MLSTEDDDHHFLQMGKYQRQLADKILTLTLEIIFLLTGEDYGPVENVSPSRNPFASGGSSTQGPIMGSFIHEGCNYQKILEFTNKIKELLTGEVSIRCHDVAVYFSMEEWEFIEERKDQYKDIISTSPEFELGEFCRPNSSPLYRTNECSFLPTMQEVRCSSRVEQNILNNWDTTTSCEAICLSNSCYPPISHIKQRIPTNIGGLLADNSINYNRHVLLDHTYAITAKKKPQLVQVRNFLDVDIPTPTTSHFTDEPKLCEQEELRYSDLPTIEGTIQYKTVQIKEEPSSCEAKSIDSVKDHMQEYQCTKVKEEPLSCLDTDSHTTADLTQGPSHIKEEPLSCLDTDFHTTADLTQGPSHIKEEPLSCLDTDFHTTADLTQGPSHIKEEPFSYDGNCYGNTAIYFTHQYTAHFQEEQPPSEIDIYLPIDTQDTKGSKAVQQKHVRQHKLLETPFLCTECGKSFQCKSGLSTHKKIHMFRKRHTCSECGKSFLRHLYLVRHQKIHSGEKPYSCEECGKCFSKKSNLTIHRKVHARKGPFSCSKCRKRFPSSSSLTQHQKIHALEKQFSCSECDKWFSSKSKFVDHQRLHSGSKTYSCPDCGKSFIKEQNLLNHQRLHTGKNPFSCIECGKLFTSNTYLIRHMRLHTMKKTSYPCPTCGKYFNSNLDLIIHQRIHAGGKPGSSSEWRNCFIRKLGFVIHQRNHAKKKPFSCPECKERFVKKSDLFRHQKVHSEEKSLST